MKKPFVDKKLLIPFIIALVGAVLVVLCLFLPYASATDEFAAALDSSPNSIISQDLRISTNDMKNVSVVDFSYMYSALSYSLFGGNDGYFYIGMVIAIGLFGLLCTLFTLVKKATPIIVFSFLNLLIVAFQNYDYYLRGVIGNEVYDWGIAVYLFYIAAALSLIGAIWMLVVKIKLKKQNVVKF
ncbi:MAG: hypothetical protein E7542_00300 [Ruminococcaceae bacterium]|nr:hypothetical protein [Oscillospiraceae bacterium]